MVTATYTVRGMTCGHCAAAVTEEVTKIAGVSDVQVDLSAGRVTVSSTQALDQSQVSAAVDEAGYELVEV
jgi:copper chaperone